MVENKVKERHMELGMTLKELAKESGLPVSTIEAGRELGVRTAQMLARALNQTIDALWPYEI